MDTVRILEAYKGAQPCMTITKLEITFPDEKRIYWRTDCEYCESYWVLLDSWSDAFTETITHLAGTDHKNQEVGT